MPEKGITKRYTFQKLAPGDFPLIIKSHRQCDHVMHSHDFIELVIIQSGKGEHLTKKESQHVSMGDVIVIPKGVRHGYDCVDDRAFSLPVAQRIQTELIQRQKSQLFFIISVFSCLQYLENEII